MVQDFLGGLDRHQCEYIVVGGYAMGAWGYIRATGDLDVFINPTQENARRVFAALAEFGAPPAGITEDDFRTIGTVFQMGIPVPCGLMLSPSLTVWISRRRPAMRNS